MTLAVLGRYWRTLRHLAPEQWLYLLWRRVLRQPRRVARPTVGAVRLDAALGCCLAASRQSWLGGTRFVFLERTRDSGPAIDWQAQGESRLWRYNMHYFDWLRQADCDPSIACAHMRDWIARNPPFAGTGWEPYPTSLRIVNWCAALARANAAEVPREIVDSLALQAAWLARNLELHLGANHLFVNLKALLFAAAIFPDDFGAALAAGARPRFARELAAQFLPDGGHYERSPMYHALLTQDLLELVALAARTPDLLPATLRERVAATAVRALAAAVALAPPGGGPLQFNDSVAGIAPEPAALGAFASALGLPDIPAAAPGRTLTVMPDSGYYLVREGGNFLAFDCGEIGPDHQPGHAHCDLLSYELFLAGDRVIGNAGNHVYDWSAERAWARSTRAHSTVEVDDAEQSEVWGAFRVGRRARPLGASLIEGPDGTRFAGAHDGYRVLPGRLTHCREALVDRDFGLRVEDSLSGGGRHRAVSWIHLAPGLVLTRRAGTHAIADTSGRAVAEIVDIDADEVEILATPRYPAFGLAQRGASLRLARSGLLPFALGYTVRPVAQVADVIERSP